MNRRSSVRTNPSLRASVARPKRRHCWVRGPNGGGVADVSRLAGQGRLPRLPTGRLGGGPTRVYRRAQVEVIARARRQPHIA
jgi:hypothetical protein